MKPISLLEGKDKVQNTMFGVKYGKIFSVNNRHQSLQTAIARMGFGIKRKKSNSWTKFATENSFKEKFARYFKDRVELESVNERLNERICAIYEKYRKTGQLKLIGDNMTPADCFIREFLKDIEKIRGLEGVYKNKVGQPIKAWTKELNGAYCAFFRECEAIFVESLKPEFIYANGKNDKDINEAMNSIPGFVKTAESDFQEFDLSQSTFTQRAERHALSFMLNSDQSLELYYLVRENVKLTSNIASGRNMEVKTSGEPATLFLNTVLSMVILCMMVDWNDLAGCAFKGDDMLIFLRRLTKTTFTIQICTEILGLPPKMLFNDVATFCGGLYANGIYHYDFSRLAQKIVSRRYTDEFDLQSYQTSVFDQLKPYFDNEVLVSANMAKHCDISIEQSRLCMQTLHAFTTVSWERMKGYLGYEISF